MDYSVAGIGKRFLAYLIDMIPITVIIFAIAFCLGFNDIQNLYFSDRSNLEYRVNFLRWRNYIRDTSFVVYLIYAIILESSNLNGTLGKYLMKIEVVNNEGNKLSFIESVKRNLFKLISILPLGLGFIWILFNKNRNGWHDYFAHTKVVNKIPLNE